MSTAPVAKTAVLSIIRGLPEAADWDVTSGFTKSPKATWVCVDEVRWENTDWATNRSRNEEFRIEVVINIRRLRKTPEEAEAEVFGMAQVIESAINESHSLGLPNVISVGWMPTNMQTFPADEAIEAQFKGTVWVSARIPKLK